jgi:hypothetical protein
MASGWLPKQRSMPTAKAVLLGRSCHPAHDAHGLPGRCTITGWLEGVAGVFVEVLSISGHLTTHQRGAP